MTVSAPAPVSPAPPTAGQQPPSQRSGPQSGAGQHARLAYALLTLTAVMWAGNAISARLAVGEISPFLLTFLRWIIGCATLALVAGAQVRAEWRLLVPSWPMIVLMGALGFTTFNALYYTAGAHTTAVNLTIIQGCVPMTVLVGSYFLYGSPISALQVLGVVITLAGVAVATTHGDLEVLRTLGFNIGDVFILVASLIYAGFTLALPKRPKVSGLVFFSAMAAVACLSSIPLAVTEIALGNAIWPTTPKAIAVLLFVSWGPTLVSQVAFIRGVELIGPDRAGIFVNLVPVFGALMAVGLLGEPFRLTDALALGLVLGGIWVAERFGRRKTVG